MSMIGRIFSRYWPPTRRYGHREMTDVVALDDPDVLGVQQTSTATYFDDKSRFFHNSHSGDKSSSAASTTAASSSNHHSPIPGKKSSVSAVPGESTSPRSAAGSRLSGQISVTPPVDDAASSSTAFSPREDSAREQKPAMTDPGKAAAAAEPNQAPAVSGEENNAATPSDENGAPPAAAPARRSPAEEARYKRQFVIQELVDTERDYVSDLQLIVDGYMAELSTTDLPEDLQGKDKIIFANIAQILDFHKTIFLREIEKCLENYEAAGLAFVKHERRLQTYYVKYCQNKPKSDFLMAQEQFEQFFTETRLKLGQKRTLNDLLIKPVQRIQKYQLLMKDILKYTDRAGDNLENLRKGFEVMCIVPKACDDMMQVGRLQNFDGNLNAQGKLLFQGQLQISEGSPNQPFKGKERIVFLFEQSAIIADCIPKRTEFSSPTYIFKNQIMVNKMVLENNIADEPMRFVLRSNDPNQPVAFLCQANSLEEKEQWLDKINSQLDQQKTLLAALVDPKRYQSQLANSMANFSINTTTKKDSSSSLHGGPVGTSASAPSPKHAAPSKANSSGGKLFGFGKKATTVNSRGPASPH